MDPLQAKANFNRICQLLIEKGSDALRRVLHVVHPAPTLAAALRSHRKTLRRLRYNVINPPQWRLLYPAAAPPNSNEFDITLLTILLRNICGLSSPAKGWNVIPPITDTSISADILRIKILRNEVYGHTAIAQYDDATFEKFWQEISQPLVRLGIPQQEIDELKVAPLSPEEKSYIEKLREWKELEDTLLKKMKDIESQMVSMRADVEKLKGTLGSPNVSKVDQLTKFDFKGKIDGLCKKFQEGTRKWLFDVLSRWFADEESRVMILTAGPGMGKSVFSAKVCQLIGEDRKLAGCHFCDFKISDSGNPSRILESLASQMCDNVDGFRDKLTEILRRNHSRDSLWNAFRVLLSEPLHALDRREPMLIVVDALDESKTNCKSELLELISDEFPQLPKWIKILITSRPELQVKRKLEHFHLLEVLLEDYNQQEDLQCFIKRRLHILNEDSIRWLAWLCKGSFLYAYYMLKELEEMPMRDVLNLSDFAPRGISGFYEKQFQRLRISLQRLNPGVFNVFLNVVAASRAPLPIRILLKCMNLSDENYEIRNTIVNIMSEILPVHDNCLTVYHKSLTDWLILDGYEEHAFVANVDGGTKRLWQVCECIYKDIVSVKSVSDFELSPERRFALENGGEYLVNVGDLVDFHWLVNIRLNALKFRICGRLKVDYYRILDIFKSSLSDDLYWSIIQHCYSMSAMQTHLHGCNLHSSVRHLHEHGPNYKRDSYLMYLQLLANAHFDFVMKNPSPQNTARDILVGENEIWMEDVEGLKNSDYKLISCTILSDSFCVSKCSPDKKLVVVVEEYMVKVFQLPSLTMIFELEFRQRCFDVVFSPDSLYFLYNSIRTCVCIRKQKEVPFIPGGPKDIGHCSFSSCGKKLVTAEANVFKLWDVEKRKLLVQVEGQGWHARSYFSSCDKYILQTRGHISSPPVVRDSTTLQEFQAIDLVCPQKCQDLGDNQIMFLVDDLMDTEHYHLSANEVVVISPVESFTWKNRRCQVLSFLSTLVICDLINQKVIDSFQIDCLPACTALHMISKLDESNFLLSLDKRQIVILSLETPEEASVFPYMVHYDLRCATLSLNHLYVACCYHKNNTFTIRSVDSGETLEMVELQKPPKACWWSEMHLWVVCEGALIRFSHYYTLSKEVLRSGREIFSLKFDRILGFGEGVFVYEESDNIKTILKICDCMPFFQKVCDLPFQKVAISKDGCAVLLYDTRLCNSYDEGIFYQLWEFTQESCWELQLNGEIRPKLFNMRVVWFSLTGTQNCRRSKFVGCECTSGGTIYNLSTLDFTSRDQYDCLLPLPEVDIDWVGDVAPNLLLFKMESLLHVLNVSDNKVIATLSFCKDDFLRFSNIFYLSSKGLLLVVLENDIKCFKIHNIENCRK